MVPDLSEYPATPQGVEDLKKDLHALIVDMWKTERASKTDDVVAVINAQTNKIHLDTRSRIYRQLREINPPPESKRDILDWLREPAPSQAGNVTIWSIVGFANGRFRVSPMTLARS